MSERGLRLCKRNASPRSPDKPKVLTRVQLGNGPASATNDSPELENAMGALASKLHLPKRKKLVQESGESLKTTTVATVTSALSRLTSVGEKLQVRHMFKTITGNRIRSKHHGN